MGFLSDQKVLYKKQFGFQKIFSTAHAAISLIENIEKAIDNKIFVCGVFVDLQKAFDIVDNNILLQKLSHNGIRDIANCWFSSYLSNRKQFVTINGFDSETQSVQCGVPQESVLGPLLFLIYINDLHSAIKFSQSFHFADDTCLHNIQSTFSKINRSLNKNLKELSFWLNANKIALNVAKTEVILFKTKHKPCDTGLRLELCRKRLYKTKYLRYLGIQIDKNLNWKIHIHDLASKLNRVNAVLAKLRHFVNSEILRSTYFAIFHSNLNYVCIAWGLTGFPQQNVSILQKKALRIMNFEPLNAHITSLFKNFNILKFADIINVESCIFINNCFNQDSFSIFNENFKLVSTMHSYNTRAARNGLLFVPSYKTVRFGRKSIIHSTTLTWNYLQDKLTKYNFLCLRPRSLKILFVKYFISEYNS